MTRTLKVTLLGTGSSGGVPRIGNEWGACDPREPKNRRSRCSAMVEVFSGSDTEPTRFLIDAAPDMREQLLRHGVGRLDAVVFSHEHADQVGGIDDLRALVQRQRRRMPVHMDARTARDLATRYAYCFEGAHGYPAILDLQRLLEPGRTFTVDGPGGPVPVLPLEQAHGAIGSLGFRIGRFAYCNDVHDLPDATLRELGGLDWLVVDALRHAPHPSHANVETALGWIRQVQTKRAVLTNMHVDLDYATLARELPEGVEPGHDGYEMALDLD